MAEANAAFLRGRAEVYRRLADAANSADAAMDMLKLAELWEAEAMAAETEQMKQTAAMSIRKPAKPVVTPSIRKQSAAGTMPLSLSTAFTLKIA